MTERQSPDGGAESNPSLRANNVLRGADFREQLNAAFEAARLPGDSGPRAVEALILPSHKEDAVDGFVGLEMLREIRHAVVTLLAKQEQERSITDSARSEPTKEDLEVRAWKLGNRRDRHHAQRMPDWRTLRAIHREAHEGEVSPRYIHREASKGDGEEEVPDELIHEEAAEGTEYADPVARHPAMAYRQTVHRLIERVVTHALANDREKKLPPERRAELPFIAKEVREMAAKIRPPSAKLR